MEKFGVKIPPSAFLTIIRMTDFKDSDICSQIVKHYKEDRSIERTASYFRTSANTVKKILKEYGLSITTGLQTAGFVLIFSSLAYAEPIEETVRASRELWDYGALGAFCLFLMSMLWFVIKSHTSERKEWKSTTERQFEQSNKLGVKVVEVMTEVKSVINSNRSNL